MGTPVVFRFVAYRVSGGLFEYLSLHLVEVMAHAHLPEGWVIFSCMSAYNASSKLCRFRLWVFFASGGICSEVA